MTSTLPHRLPRQRTVEVAPSRTTPYLELDVSTAVRHFVDLAAALPGTAVHYAVKANPHPQLLRELAAVGCRFDVASPAEVRAALDAGATPRRPRLLQPGQAPRPRRRVGGTRGPALRRRLPRRGRQGGRGRSGEPGAVPARHVRRGLRLAAVAQVRLLDRTRRSRCSRLADQLGLEAAGVSFHVGSQQRDPEAWAKPIARRRPRVRAPAHPRHLPQRPRPRWRVPGFARGRLPPGRVVRRGHRTPPPALLRRRPPRDADRARTRHRR